MHKLKRIIGCRRNVLLLIALEILAVVIYGVVCAATFSTQELTFTEGDMQLRDYGNGVKEGNYLDTSFTDTRAVVTPAFRLQKGIWYMDASYTGHGLIKAGLIYDSSRNGQELVDGDEFELRMESGSIAYRVKIRDDSPVRFKLRLTGDAADGDYIQLLKVHVTSSRLTYVYRLFCLIAVLLVADMLVWGCFKYGRTLGMESRFVYATLAVTAFFVGLPMYRAGLGSGNDLTFHLSRLEGLYKGLKFCGGGWKPVPRQDSAMVAERLGICGVSLLW